MADCDTVKERLIVFIKYLNIGQGKFEKQCGLSNGFVNNIRVSIKPPKLQQIAQRFPELSLGWLMTGEGEMLKEPSTTVGEVSGDDNIIGMTVTQTIGENSGQNAGRDIANSTDRMFLDEIAAQRKITEVAQTQLMTAQTQITELINQNRVQFDKFTSLLENLTQR